MSIKDDMISRRDVYDLDPKIIQVEEGFNLRKDFGDDFEEFSSDIATNGVKNPITVKRTKDGVYFVRDGRRRLRAAQAKGLEKISCMLEEKNVSDIEAIFNALSGNNSKPFTDEEKGEGFRRLLGFGCKKADLAKRTGCTVKYIDGCMSKAANPEYKELSADAASLLSKVSKSQAASILASGAKTAAGVKQVLNGTTTKAPKPKALKLEVTRIQNKQREDGLNDYETGYLRGLGAALGTERFLDRKEDKK